MTTHTNYEIIFTHPDTGEDVECDVSFCYTVPHGGWWDEPPEYGNVEIYSVFYNGEDITKKLSYEQLYEAEGELLAGKLENY